MTSLNRIGAEFGVPEQILTQFPLHELRTLSSELAMAVEDTEEVVVRARTCSG